MATALVRVPGLPRAVEALVGKKDGRGDWPDLDLTLTDHMVQMRLTTSEGRIVRATFATYQAVRVTTIDCFNLDHKPDGWLLERLESPWIKDLNDTLHKSDRDADFLDDARHYVVLGYDNVVEVVATEAEWRLGEGTIDTPRADAFGELLIRGVRDPLVEEALVEAELQDDDGTEAVRTIDDVLTRVLSMFDDPQWQDEVIHRVPVRIMVGPEDADAADSSGGGPVDLAATSDGLVGDFVGWVERFSKHPRMPWLEPLRTSPSDDIAFRRAVRTQMRRLLSGQLPEVALEDDADLVMPPGGLLYPELTESMASDGQPCWIGKVRLYRRDGEGRVPTDLVVWLEVIESDDAAVSIRVINVLQGLVSDDPTGEDG